MQHSSSQEIPGPQVLYPLTIGKFFRYLLSHHGLSRPATLIICLSFESFGEKFLSDIPHNDPLLTPTLQLLSDTKYIDVAFVPTLPVLLAMLSIYDGQQRHINNQASYSLLEGEPTIGTLILMFPLRLHADTPSNSAQGLSRTFASAVSASIRVKERLVIVEPVPPAPASRSVGLQHDDTQTQQDDGVQSRGSPEVVAEQTDPWDQHVPILNVTSSRFGAGERGWVGRTVAARSVAEQWFTFERVNPEG